jgi:hypothetical protein
MDSDSRHDDGDNEQRQNSSNIGSDVDGENFEPSEGGPHSGKLKPLPQKVKPEAPNYSELKWKATQSSYEDNYAEFLRNDLAEGEDDGVAQVNLEQSQVGAVTWYPYEKIALYQALSKGGQRDLPFLANAIGSKSQLEVQAYLLLLGEKLSERHLFYRQTKSISHADVPAAVEISSTVEEALEQAANAQLAYDEYYEHVANSQKSNGLWVIDGREAESLDNDHDKAEEALLESGETADKSAFESPLFHISTFIELSERLFMNYGDSSSHGNWRKVAVEGETPAMTKEVVSELYELAISFSRKLIQTSLFLAQSRQRATTNSHYRHCAMVREQDVAASINVLDLKCDLWDFWVGVPRRNKLDIVDNRRRKGYGRNMLMPYKIVEQILSKRKARWRGRRRSTSLGPHTSMTEDEAFDTADQMDEDSSEDHGSDSNSSARPLYPSSDESTHEPEAHPLDAVLDSDASATSPGDLSSDSPDSDAAESDESGGFASYGALSRQKRRQMDLEEQQDEYLKQIDAKASREEEFRLLQVLGRETPEMIKPENDKDTEMLVRPKVLRKSMDDLGDALQGHKYGAEWELFGAVVPNENFAETERARKRPRPAYKEVPTNRARRTRGKRRELPIRTRSPSTRSSLDLSRDTSEDDL